MNPIIAVLIEDDQAGKFFYNPVHITSYLDAVNYEIENKDTPHLIEYVIFNDTLNVNDIISDMEYHYSEYIDYFDIEDLQQYFNVTEHTYSDGTISYIGDLVLVNSADISWGFFVSTTISGYVSSLDTPHYIQLKLDGFNREIRLPHYKVTLWKRY